MLIFLGVLAAAALGAGASYAASRTRRAVRRVKRARGEVIDEIERTEDVLDSRKRALREEADRYAATQVQERLRDLPLDVLRNQTRSGVRLSPLREAGIDTVGDLVGRSARELRAIKGIGAHSAKALEKAAREFVETARRTPPPLPGAALDEPGSEPLARAALLTRDAWRELGEEPARLRAALAPINERIAAQPSSFFDWARRRTTPEQLLALADELGRIEGAAEARDRVGRRAPEDVRAEFERHYADCCALIEDALGEVGAPERKQVPGAAPAQAEIARRVEAHPLRTDGLRVILRRYQAFGARYILAMERTVLGDEMGLGKTIQALAATMHLSNESGCERFLVVAPASILGNWMHEIGERTPLPAHLLHGDAFDEGLAAWRAGGGVAVTSYTTLRRNVAGFATAEVDLLVADEAHYVKNPEARRTQALRRIANGAARVCFMSGTPLENHPEEFVHLLESLAPRRARDLSDFLKRPGSVLGGPKHFHAEVADVYLRRNQEDVLKELPDRIDKQEWIDLSLDEHVAYTAMVGAGNFMGMRQAVTGESKFLRLEDLLNEYRETGTKVLLFSYFLRVLAAVAERFPTYGAITGNVPPEERFALVQRFNEAEGHALLCGQITAAGTGLNLQSAGAVVLMEPQLKPTTEAQAIARAHRMGQTRRVVVHRLLARDCVDERLVEILAGKQELFDRFARESLVKDASEEATATAILKTERERLA